MPFVKGIVQCLGGNCSQIRVNNSDNCYVKRKSYLPYLYYSSKHELKGTFKILFNT